MAVLTALTKRQMDHFQSHIVKPNANLPLVLLPIIMIRVRKVMILKCKTLMLLAIVVVRQKMKGLAIYLPFL